MTDKTLDQEIAAYDAHMQSIGGCTDGGCVIVRPKGMHTNGGCKCPRDYIKMQRAMYAAKKLRDAAACHTGMGTLEGFQSGVARWMGECFMPSLYSNMTERGDRLLEEVLELLQAHGYDQARVATLADYVYGRPVGEPAQEVGGVMVTLAGYCWIAGLDMHAAGSDELARITQPEVMAKIRAKQEAKNALHFDTPLPGGAASARVLTCVYCGHEYPQDTPTHGDRVLTEHIAKCAKHPMRQAQATIERLRAALVAFVGVSETQQLREFEAVLRAHPGSEEDKAVAINAIQALLAAQEGEVQA